MLRIAYGQRWSETEAPSALAVYSLYICLLAVNGILEAFQHAVATSKELGRSNTWLIAFAVAHLALSIGAVGRYGSVGLIWAGGGNMALRIAYSIAFVRRHFSGSVSVRGLFPRGRTLVAFAAALCLTSLSNALLLGGAGQLVDGCKDACPVAGFWSFAMYHVALGAVTLAGLAVFLYRTEQQLWASLRSVRRKQE